MSYQNPGVISRALKREVTWRWGSVHNLKPEAGRIFRVSHVSAPEDSEDAIPVLAGSHAMYSMDPIQP